MTRGASHTHLPHSIQTTDTNNMVIYLLAFKIKAQNNSTTSRVSSIGGGHVRTKYSTPHPNSDCMLKWLASSTPSSPLNLLDQILVGEEVNYEEEEDHIKKFQKLFEVNILKIKEKGRLVITLNTHPKTKSRNHLMPLPDPSPPHTHI